VVKIFAVISTGSKRIGESEPEDTCGSSEFIYERVCPSDNRYFESQVPAKAESASDTGVTHEHTKSGRWEGNGWQNDGQVVGGKSA
jgi:hypothetical protein